MPAIAVAGCATTPGDPGYEHFITGNPADTKADTRPLVVLQGGGDDVDANYVRMGEYAGGGDFIVLRASGGDEYNDYIFDLCRCDSVETIVFSGREAAFDPFVTQRLEQAEAIFIAGGDQSNYVRFWKGTPVEDAINAAATSGRPVGGTSAGMAILGEFSYAAMSAASLTSPNALADPYHVDATLERDFLHLAGLENIITDQHLIERDRLGRTIALMARLLCDGWTNEARAIASDRETAVHLDPNTGKAVVHATTRHETPYSYFLRLDVKPADCRPGVPLSIDGVEVYRLSPGGEFDLLAWRGSEGLAYTLAAHAGALSSSRKSIY